MRTVAYVSNAASGSISVLGLDGDSGALTTLQELVLGGPIMPLALTPDGRWLLAARRHAPLAVLSLAIAPDDGRLTLLGETALPASMPSIATDRSGHWLLSASYQDGLVAVSAIGGDGRVLPAHQVLASGAKTHRLLSTPENRHALACVLGTDELLRYRFDSRRGVLSEPEALRLRAGSGPRHLVTDATGQRAWVLGELDGSISTIDLQSDRMAVLDVTSALPSEFVGTPWAAELRLHPAGGLLVVSERTGSTLTLLAVDGDDGCPHRLGHWPTQAQPRGFAISPCGRWLLCAGQRSHRVGVHHIDRHAGVLEFVGNTAVGQDPNWVEVLQLP